MTQPNASEPLRAVISGWYDEGLIRFAASLSGDDFMADELVADLRAAIASQPEPLDAGLLWEVLEGMGVLANGTWVSFQVADADMIAEDYRLRLDAARLPEEPR